MTPGTALLKLWDYQYTGDGMHPRVHASRRKTKQASTITLQETEMKEEPMFARQVTLLLKPNLAKEFPITFEKEIVPLLKKQKGFVDELLLITPEKKEVVSISLWENKECAEIYNREMYPKAEKIVERLIDGVPTIKNFETEFCTFHKTV